MSASMLWRPVNPKPDGEYVEDAFRQAIAKRLWGGDASSSTQPHELDASDLPYLNGLRDGGVKGAQVIIDAIQKHGSIEIWIER
jgi:hypothetical protein